MALQVEDAVLLLCDRVTRDPKSSKVALEGVFDRVQVTTYPGGLNFSLYVRFYIDDTKLSQVPIRMAIHLPRGAVVQLPVFSAVVQPGPRAEAICNFEGFPIEDEGRYVFVLSVGDAEIGRVRFEAISSGGTHGTSQTRTSE